MHVLSFYFLVCFIIIIIISGVATERLILSDAKCRYKSGFLTLFMPFPMMAAARWRARDKKIISLTAWVASLSVRRHLQLLELIPRRCSNSPILTGGAVYCSSSSIFSVYNVKRLHPRAVGWIIDGDTQHSRDGNVVLLLYSIDILATFSSSRGIISFCLSSSRFISVSHFSFLHSLICYYGIKINHCNDLFSFGICNIRYFDEFLFLTRNISSSLLLIAPCNCALR